MYFSHFWEYMLFCYNKKASLKAGFFNSINQVSFDCIKRFEFTKRPKKTKKPLQFNEAVFL